MQTGLCKQLNESDNPSITKRLHRILISFEALRELLLSHLKFKYTVLQNLCSKVEYF